MDRQDGSRAAGGMRSMHEPTTPRTPAPNSHPTRPTLQNPANRDALCFLGNCVVASSPGVCGQGPLPQIVAVGLCSNFVAETVQRRFHPTPHKLRSGLGLRRLNLGRVAASLVRWTGRTGPAPWGVAVDARTHYATDPSPKLSPNETHT